MQKNLGICRVWRPQFFEGAHHEASKILYSRNGIFVFLPKALKLVQRKIGKRIEEPKTPTKPMEFEHFPKIQEIVESDHCFLVFS